MRYFGDNTAAPIKEVIKRYDQDLDSATFTAFGCREEFNFEALDDFKDGKIDSDDIYEKHYEDSLRTAQVAFLEGFLSAIRIFDCNLSAFDLSAIISNGMKEGIACNHKYVIERYRKIKANQNESFIEGEVKREDGTYFYVSFLVDDGKRIFDLWECEVDALDKPVDSDDIDFDSFLDEDISEIASMLLDIWNRDPHIGPHGEWCSL